MIYVFPSLECVMLTTYVKVVYHVTYITEPTKAWHIAVVTKVACTGRCLKLKIVKLKL
jgi:hypothetical protein